MKLIKTNKVDYFKDKDDFFCFIVDGVKTKFQSLIELKFHADTLYKLNGKRKIN